MAAFNPAQALLATTIQSAWGDLVRGVYTPSLPRPSAPAPMGHVPSPAPAPEDDPATAPEGGGNADARRRGRAGLVQTSLRGVLSPRPDGLTRKSLLGE